MSDVNLFSGDYGVNRQKVLVVEKPEIVVHGTRKKPYFEIKYKKVGQTTYNIGYSSYDLNNCFQWLEEFEFVAPGEEKEEKEEKKSEEKTIQFPVDMDEIQKSILIELLNARKECTNENILTVHGIVAIIDALFYLVKEKSIMVCGSVDMGYSDSDKTGGQTDEKDK